jgi:3-hydroxyisobutyrate dehydrogenase
MPASTNERTPSDMPPVGFIGLGAMGLPMACCVARAGLPILACDTDAARLAMLAAAGGPVATTMDLGEIGARCDTVILMLPTSRHVDAVLAQLRPSLRTGSLVIDMGSSIPRETRRLAREMTEAGLRLMDAPVSGAIVGAQAGTLSIMAGGSDADVEQAAPYLAAIGRTTIRTGAVGSGHAMKALNNFVYASGLLAAVEALRMGEAVGLDLDVLTDVLNASSGRNYATETKVKQFILPGKFVGGFKLGLMAKDLETAGSLADETGVNAASLTVCRAAWRHALEVLGPDADTTEIHKTIGAA